MPIFSILAQKIDLHLLKGSFHGYLPPHYPMRMRQGYAPGHPEDQSVIFLCWFRKHLTSFFLFAVFLSIFLAYTVTRVLLGVARLCLGRIWILIPFGLSACY